MSNEYETWKAYAENLQAQRENDADTIAQMAIELGETRQERDHFRAVLEGARYPNLDNLKDRPYAQCRQIGEVVADLTKALIEEHKAYRAALREAVRLLDTSVVVGGNGEIHWAFVEEFIARMHVAGVV